jgi:hypothetical protein
MLLAMIAFACLAPATADATRRDDRGGTARSTAAQVSKANPAAKPAGQAARPTPTAARATSRTATASPRPAAARTAARSRDAGARATASRAISRRMTAQPPNELRSQRLNLVVRGASAATISRDAMATCTRRNGRTVCGTRESVAGWQSGLPPADYAQRDCPAGTFATLARGHDDVVRCMPI